MLSGDAASGARQNTQHSPLTRSWDWRNTSPAEMEHGARNSALQARPNNQSVAKVRSCCSLIMADGLYTHRDEKETNPSSRSPFHIWQYDNHSIFLGDTRILMWSSFSFTSASNPLETISSIDIRSVTMLWYPGNLPGNVSVEVLTNKGKLLTLPNQADGVFEVLLVVAVRARSFYFFAEELPERDCHL